MSMMCSRRTYAIIKDGKEIGKLKVDIDIDVESSLEQTDEKISVKEKS